MNNTLIVPVGIPGSGKTYFRNTLLSYLPDITVVSPDEIRKELTGNISDQSVNNKVFETAYHRIYETFCTNNSKVFFDATNLGESFNRLYERFIGNKFVIVDMVDSFYPDSCYLRIKEDLKKGIDRSNVPEDKVYQMAERYKSTIAQLQELRTMKAGISMHWFGSTMGSNADEVLDFAEWFTIL